MRENPPERYLSVSRMRESLPERYLTVSRMRERLFGRFSEEFSLKACLIGEYALVLGQMRYPPFPGGSLGIKINPQESRLRNGPFR